MFIAGVGYALSACPDIAGQEYIRDKRAIFIDYNECADVYQFVYSKPVTKIFYVYCLLTFRNRINILNLTEARDVIKNVSLTGLTFTFAMFSDGEKGQTCTSMMQSFVLPSSRVKTDPLGYLVSQPGAGARVVSKLLLDLVVLGIMNLESYYPFLR